MTWKNWWWALFNAWLKNLIQPVRWIEKIRSVWKDVAFDLPEIRKALKQFAKRVRTFNENDGNCTKMFRIELLKAILKKIFSHCCSISFWLFTKIFASGQNRKKKFWRQNDEIRTSHFSLTLQFLQLFCNYKWYQAEI